MEQPSQAGLQVLATAASVAHPILYPTTFAPDEHPGNGHMSIVVLSRRLGPALASHHWAIAVITDEQSHRARVYHLSDRHIHFAPGQTVHAQDEDLNSAPGYEGGVRIGTVHSSHLPAFDEAIHRYQLPPPNTPGGRSCKNWTLYMIRYLERRTFRLSTHSLKDDVLFDNLISGIQVSAQRRMELRSPSPVFVTLLESSTRR